MSKYELVVPFWYVVIVAALSGLISVFVGGIIGSVIAKVIEQPSVIWITICALWIVSFLFLVCISSDQEV